MEYRNKYNRLDMDVLKEAKLALKKIAEFADVILKIVE
jgi:hypothetical protein